MTVCQALGPLISTLRENEIDVDIFAYKKYDFIASMSRRLNGTQKVLHEILGR